MANTYFKMLNVSTREQFKENIISEVQRNLSDSAKLLDESLFDSIEKIKQNKVSGKNLDINILLKFYVINQLLKETIDEEKALEEKRLGGIANSEIKGVAA